ncbi:ras guanine nucleotide exchange factor domain-containing protein, partial [Lipomyces japonicus]|uniref:ras guanine nucleotide exchange factor domain-containing protein n=1 Tax=Lipomyces japonicus TaxID=56871 RepID=UPI0034D00180
MKWGLSAKQPQLGGQAVSLDSQAYGLESSSRNHSYASQTNLLALHASNTTSLLATSKPDDDMSTSLPHKTSARPLRLFKHKKDADFDTHDGSPRMAHSPSVLHVPVSPDLIPSSPDSIASDSKPREVISGFSTNYKTVSMSVNDLSHFVRGSAQVGNKSPLKKEVTASSSKLNLSGPQYQTKKEGWINRADGESKKIGYTKVISWKLQKAVLKDNFLYLYKPPAEIGAKSFDFVARSVLKGPAKENENGRYGITHRLTTKHKDLIIDENSNIISGTIEAICHEVVFGDDEAFVKDALLMLPMWTSASTAFEYIAEFALLEDRSERICTIVEIIVSYMGSLLLDSNVNLSIDSLLDSINIRDEGKYKIMKDKINERLNQMSETLKPDSSVPLSDTFVQELAAGFTAHFFSNADIEVFADQIHSFNLRIFRSWSPINDFSMLFALKYASCRKNPQVPTSKYPNFIGTLMIQHLFPSNNPTSNSPATMADLLSRWIIAGNILKLKGDMIGWLAIANIACSPAVCRLKKVWSLVSPDVVDIVNRDWAPVIFELDRRIIVSETSSRRESAHILAPDGIGKTYQKEAVVPYFGDISVHYFEKLTEINRDGLRVMESRKELYQIQKSLERWSNYIHNVQNESSLRTIEPPIKAFQECLYKAYETAQGSSIITPSGLLDLSLQYEPPSTGLYAQYYTSQRSPLSTGSYSPLIFTEILTSYKLFAPKDILEAGGLLYKRSVSSLKSKASAEHVFQSPSSQYQSTEIGKRHLRRASSFPPSKSNVNITGYSDLDATSRNRTAALPNRHFLIKTVRDVLNMGVTLYHVENDLILKSFKEESVRTSRLSSVIMENPSKRLSSGSRPLSAQFQSSRHSSGADLQIFEYKSAQPLALNVVTKDGSLNRLLDVLVIGIEEFSTRIGAEDVFYLQKFGQIVFKMNMDIFTSTFFATFRSFCTADRLLDALRKRFLGARSVAASRLNNDNKSMNSLFPDWDSVITDNKDIDWEMMAKIQIGILEACNLWISEYYSDFLNDIRLRDSFLEFLRDVDAEDIAWHKRIENYNSLKEHAESIASLLRKLRKSFARRSYRPVEFTPTLSFTEHVHKLKFPEYDNAKIIQFCESLDHLVGCVFASIKLKDWLVVYEVFEMQTVDPMNMFGNWSSPNIAEEDILIQDIFSYLATLHCFRSDELMVSLLPHPIKRLFAFRMNLVSWLSSYVADPSLRRFQRVRRMATLLKAIAICRKRMSVIDFGLRSDSDERLNIPSFVESAISAAIVRPESRQYAAAWLLAAVEVGIDVHQIENLEQIIPRLDDNKRESDGSSDIIRESFSPCIGWVFERIFEIVCYVPNMSLEKPRLINFDKQRYIYNFLSNIVDLRPWKRSSTNGL